MKIEEKLTVDAIKNDRESHIRLDKAVCSGCTEHYCVLVCPGHLYSVDEETKEVSVEYAGCLECGTCSIACTRHAISWEYPKGEYGVQYRYG